MGTSCTFASMSEIASMGLACERSAGVATRRSLRSLAVSALFALVLGAACTSIPTKLDSPVVTLETVRILSVADARANLALVLRLRSPDRFDLSGETIEYVVTLGDQQ